MVDLLKAQIQSAKLIARRATKQVQENLDTYSNSTDSKVQALESYRSAQEAKNAPGATTEFSGTVKVQENLTVQGSATINGEEVATKNFVLVNAGGGAGGSGSVDMTNTFRAEGDGTEKVYEIPFVGTSIGVFRNGFKLDTTDYTLLSEIENTETPDAQADKITVDKNIKEIISLKVNGNEYNLDNVTIQDAVISLAEDHDGESTEVKYYNKSKVTLAIAPDDGDILNFVCYGGADVYTKTQSNAQFIDRDTIISTYATKAETSAVSGDTGWVDLKPYLVNDWVEYSDGYPIEYRKLGDVVYLRGLVKDGTAVKVFDGLPASLRPTHDTYLAMPGCSDIPENSTNDWKFGIRTDGSVDYSDDNIGMTWCSIACQYLVN